MDENKFETGTVVGDVGLYFNGSPSRIVIRRYYAFRWPRVCLVVWFGKFYFPHPSIRFRSA